MRKKKKLSKAEQDKVNQYKKDKKTLCYYCKQSLPFEIPEGFGTQGIFHKECQEKVWEESHKIYEENRIELERKMNEAKETLKKQDICNLCGYSCQLIESHHSNMGGLIGEVKGGYSSTPGNGCGALDDGTKYQFLLCEFCLDFLFSSFNVPVKLIDYMSGDQREEFRPAINRVQEDEWRKMKLEFFLECEKRAKARKIGTQYEELLMNKVLNPGA